MFYIFGAQYSVLLIQIIIINNGTPKQLAGHH